MLTIFGCAVFFGLLFLAVKKDMRSAGTGLFFGAMLGFFASIFLHVAAPMEERIKDIQVSGISAEHGNNQVFGLLNENGKNYVVCIAKENDRLQKMKIGLADTMIAAGPNPLFKEVTKEMRPGWRWWWALGNKKWVFRYLYVPRNSIFVFMAFETIPEI
jgi:hypothetical protein